MERQPPGSSLTDTLSPYTTPFRSWPRLLEPPQQHDLDQAADMQAGRGRVEPDIAGHDLLRGKGIEPVRVGRLVDIAPLVEQAQQVGFITGHNGRALSMGRSEGHTSELQSLMHSSYSDFCLKTHNNQNTY